MAEQMFKASSVDLNFYHNDVKSEKALFLIPGGWGTWRGWSELIEDFNDHAIYAISPPGRGNSGRIRKYDLTTQVDPIIEWIRAIDHLPDDPDLHRSLLAYLSDYYFFGTSTQPHGIRWEQRNIQMASLDHAMWFHRPFRADEWMLYAIESPNASGARGLVMGRFFKLDGTLVASTVQEGLVRVWPDTN